MWRKCTMYLFARHLTLAAAWLWIHFLALGLWWDWKLFVFIVCMQKHLFTVTSAASEHLKAQSKQSSNNSCYLDSSSLLTKLEKKRKKKICVSSVLLHYDSDRIMAIDFNTLLCNGDETSPLQWRDLKSKVVLCHFGIRITNERNLDVCFKWNNTY